MFSLNIFCVDLPHTIIYYICVFESSDQLISKVQIITFFYPVFGLLHNAVLLKYMDSKLIRKDCKAIKEAISQVCFQLTEDACIHL